MTKEEAIKEGYTHYGYDEQDYQHLSKLEDLTEEDFANSNKTILLAEKTPIYPGIAADTLCEIVCDHIMDQDETRQDDTDSIPDALKSGIDWNAWAQQINLVLKGHPRWFLTDIRLTLTNH